MDISNEQTPAVSVLVPIYNVERYLGECLDSLRGQTFTDFEVICINDGSTDGSREIIQRYLDADARFRVIDKPNSGYGSSMNRGLDEARGEYVAILESDDIFELDALEKLHTAAAANNADVVKADFWFYWSNPPRCEEFGFVEPAWCGRVLDPKTEPGIFYKKPSIWSALYRAAFLRENDIRFLETPGASYQDAGFNFKVFAAAQRAVFIPDFILNYRQDNEASSVNNPGKVYCVCDEYAEMERYLADRPQLRTQMEGVKERMKFDTYMWNYDRLAPELQDEFLQRAAEEFKADLAAGDVDLSLFEPWAEADLNALVANPAKFKQARAKYLRPGKFNTFMHYYSLGGFKLIRKVMAYKKAGR